MYSNPRDHIILTNHVVSTISTPRLIQETVGVSLAGTVGETTWSGIYGNQSTSRAGQFTQRFAEERNLQCFTIRTLIELRDLEKTKGSLTPSQVNKSGFLHLGRIKASYRDELHVYVLARLKAIADETQMCKLRELNFKQLNIRFPIIAEFLLEAHPAVTLVVQPCTIIYGDDVPLWVGTVRKIDLQRFKSTTRYLEKSHPVF